MFEQLMEKSDEFESDTNLNAVHWDQTYPATAAGNGEYPVGMSHP
jgi:hypothetical protein